MLRDTLPCDKERNAIDRDIAKRYSGVVDLKTYAENMDRRIALAKALATSPDYLWQLANGWRDRRPSPGLARRIEQATTELGPEPVTKESLRPDVWGKAA